MNQKELLLDAAAGEKVLDDAVCKMRSGLGGGTLGLKHFPAESRG